MVTLWLQDILESRKKVLAIIMQAPVVIICILSLLIRSVLLTSKQNAIHLSSLLRINRSSFYLFMHKALIRIKLNFLWSAVWPSLSSDLHIRFYVLTIICVAVGHPPPIPTIISWITIKYLYRSSVKWASPPQRFFPGRPLRGKLSIWWCGREIPQLFQSCTPSAVWCYVCYYAAL